MMGNSFNVGIIGCGGIATAKHIPILRKMNEVNIAAICDGSPSRAEAVSREFNLDGAGIYTDYMQLIEDDRVDVVHICTPNSTHAEISIAALERGKHVMCEKPMATTSREARAMVAAQRRSGKKLTICANYRFRKDAWHLKKLVDAGAIGDIYYAKAHAVRRRGVPTWGSFLDKATQGGGPVIDIGIHSLDMALWLMNNYSPKSVFAVTNNRLGKIGSPANPYGNWNTEEYTVEDLGVGLITMENGATIFIEASWALNTMDTREASVTLCGTKGGACNANESLIINGEENGLLYDKAILTKPNGVNFYDVAEVYGPELEMRTWVDAVLNDTNPVVMPEEMLTASEIIEAMYASADSGSAVSCAS